MQLTIGIKQCKRVKLFTAAKSHSWGQVSKKLWQKQKG
jgi:hypothetical protein